jgi:4-amino-4-deoxy-L-arabinose transferase-like glycosyltransferase
MTIEPPVKKHSATILIGFIIIFALFSFFFNLGGRTLENQDNMRFAEVSREILETGDTVMMHLGGDIYIDKPPLHFWNTALSYRLFGVNTFAARFPSALFALIGFFGVLFFCLSVDRENPKTGIYAALFLVSNYGYAYYARTVRLDMEYSVLFSLSLISFYMGYESVKRKSAVIFYLLFWFFMGMAFLVKGPVAFISLLIVPIYLLIRRDWERLRFGLFASTALALIVTITPWAMLLYSHPDFDKYLGLLKTSTIMTRKEVFYYYFPSFMVNFFPGSVFMVITLFFFRRWKDAIKERPWLVFCLVWFAVYFVMLHLTVAKTFRYLLPVFPPVSVIAAWGMERMFDTGVLNRNPGKYRKVLASISAFLICLTPAAWILFHGGRIAGALVFAIAGIFSLFFAWSRSKDAAVFVCILCMLGLLGLDIIRTAYNTQVSHNLRLYTLLKENHIQSDEVLLYRTDRDVKRMLGFYYNRLPRQKNDIIDVEKGVKAIVAAPDSVGEVLKVYGPGNKIIQINSPDGEFKCSVVFTLP